jgi:hypothetical protein
LLAPGNRVSVADTLGPSSDEERRNGAAPLHASGAFNFGDWWTTFMRLLFASNRMDSTAALLL